MQSRTFLFAHGRQLCRITHHHQAATCASVDKLDEVVQQTTGAKEAVSAVVGYHRGLIDDEQGFFERIPSGIEVSVLPLEGILTIDNLVDGVGRTAGMEREDFGRTSCWSQQHHGALQLLPNAHHSAHE